MVGARRASIMVFDEAGGVLRTVAARGFGTEGLQPVQRGGRLLHRRPGVPRAPHHRLRSAHPDGDAAECGDDRGYEGDAFLSVPICYGAPAAPLRCVGVINLTDRIGGDRFTLGDRKLVGRHRQPDRRGGGECPAGGARRHQQRLRRELELAHDLQLKLLPSPAVLQGDAEVAARC